MDACLDAKETCWQPSTATNARCRDSLKQEQVLCQVTMAVRQDRQRTYLLFFLFLPHEIFLPQNEVADSLGTAKPGPRKRRWLVRSSSDD